MKTAWNPQSVSKMTTKRMPSSSNDSGRIPELSQWLAAFARLSAEERERSSELIDAYNSAVAEFRRASFESGGDPSILFTVQEIERVVSDYQARNLANIRPAMRRYLQLLEHGYQAPELK